MLKRYLMRLGKWARYATGASYQHKPQNEGTRFVPGAIEGYFNDLRAKADFTGEMREEVPVVKTDTAEAFFFPIVIFQWGLANWDLWLDSGRNDNLRRANVLAAARWAARAIDAQGGWLCWTGLVRPVTSNYSAMAQGEGASLLVRAHEIEPEEGYLALAERAIAFMLTPGPQQLVRDWGDWKSLEEYPGNAMPAVLNGWCFALMGLEELSLVAPNQELCQARATYAEGLAKALPRFDTGYWSTYDLGGNLASPFYHNLHIAQLRSLARVFPEHASRFLEAADRFDRYRNSRICTLRAVGVKVVQKLLQPAVGEMA